ncbi:MAG: hypothetical protein KF703_02100 [Actinobacteria bacterium]|nr:hypothetical protein [Actinomycetota bacterium]
MPRSPRPVARSSAARLAALALVVALVGAACSNSSSDQRSDEPPRSSTTTTTTTTTAPTTTTPPASIPTGQDYVDALAAALATGASGGLPVDAEAARCLAPRWIDVLGEDRLVAAGVTPEQLASGYGADTSAALDELIDDDAAKAMVAAFGACKVDVEQVFIDALAAGRTLPQEQQDCLRAAFPDGFVERALELGLSQGEAAVEADVQLTDTLTAAARDCTG